MAHPEQIQIGDVTLSISEAEEILAAIRAGRIDAVVVAAAGSRGEQVYTFRDPGHPYRLLVEAMGEGAALVTLDGTIAYKNPCLAELLGVGGLTTYGRSLSEFVPAPARAELEALLEHGRAGRPARGELAVFGANGRTVPVQMSFSLASLADIKVLCVVVTDLSEYRRQEELYRVARLEIEARDRLLSVAAHELRGPLNVLEMQTQLLRGVPGRDNSALPKGTVELIEGIARQGHRLAELVGKLLDVGSIGSGRLRLERAPTNLGEIVRVVAERDRQIIERSGSPLFLAVSPVTGIWDRIRIEQVVANLLSNAAKFGEGKPIRASVETVGGVARLIVEDHGKGIPVDARERIFRPYERVAESQAAPGMGLGLYITAEVVKAHGGRIRVEEVAGGGSRFMVDLPLEERAAG